MNLSGTEMSCGVMQMEGVNSAPKGILLDLGNEIYNEYMKCAFVQWSDVWGRNKGGNKLYHYIRRNFPKSQLQRTKTAINPNTRNKICVYIWKIPRNFKKWWVKNQPKARAATGLHCDNYCRQYGCDCHLN